MLTIFLVTILVILAYWSTRKPKDLPPGESRAIGKISYYVVIMVILIIIVA